MDRIRHQLHLDDRLFESKNGKNIGVAVLDSGIACHPDFDHRIIYFMDCINGKNTPYDDFGHGTHVCGILGGTGILSQGRYKGIASECNLLVYKILNHKGEGKTEYLLNAIRSILKNRQKFSIRIVNISVGMDPYANGNEALLNLHRVRNAIRELTDHGIIVVTAAGNNGPSMNHLSAIGSLKQVLSVGCHDGDYKPIRGVLCETYSARGVARTDYRKPDIVAPGTEITSCSHQFYRFRNTVRNAYCQKSGTSMATPIVSGVLAIYLEQNPDDTVDMVLNRIRRTAFSLNEPFEKQGYGMVNPVRMLS